MSRKIVYCYYCGELRQNLAPDSVCNSWHKCHSFGARWEKGTYYHARPKASLNEKQRQEVAKVSAHLRWLKQAVIKRDSLKAELAKTEDLIDDLYLQISQNCNLDNLQGIK